MTRNAYVHGYTDYESGRLHESARALEHLLHDGVRYAPEERVLEAGCGTGAQTVALCQNNPCTHFVCIDRAHDFIRTAQQKARVEGYTPPRFIQADLTTPPFSSQSFNHIYICYVLEHLVEPLSALECLIPCLSPQGSLTAIEGDHGSCFFYPETDEALAVWQCLPDIQCHLGGNGNLGRRLYALCTEAGLLDVTVTPLNVYCDPSHPALMEGFVEKTIVGMLRGIETEVLQNGMMDPASWYKGLDDILRIIHDPEGVFCYTFFRARGHVP